MPTDLELFALTQRHDAAAFEALFRRYHQPLCDFVLTYVRASALAEDVVQDLFVALWTEGYGWKVNTTLRAYLFGAARNRALKLLRREGRIGDLPDEEAPGAEESPAMSQPALPPDADLESSETTRILDAAIASLPDRTRLAITLRWSQEMSHAEIADAMDISQKGVEKLLSVGMAKLRAAVTAR